MIFKNPTFGTHRLEKAIYIEKKMLIPQKTLYLRCMGA